MQIGCFDVDVYVHFRKESSEMVLILLLFYVTSSMEAIRNGR